MNVRIEHIEPLKSLKEVLTNHLLRLVLSAAFSCQISLTCNQNSVSDKQFVGNRQVKRECQVIALRKSQQPSGW